MPNALDNAYSEISKRLGPYDDKEERDYPVPDLPVTDPWNGLDELDSDDFVRDLDARTSLSDPELDNEDRRLVDGGIREIGMEALALYKSFRYANLRPFAGHWGIFYLEPGIKRVLELIQHYDPHHPDPRSTAIEFLRRHERTHFKFDVYALGLESALSKHLYEPLKRAFRPYAIYQVEEGLANHEAWRWASNKKHGPAIKAFAKDFMSLQPGGYSRFQEDRKDLASELAANLLDLNLTSGARREDQALWVANIPAAMAKWQSYCPEHSVSSAVLTRWINPAWKFPEVLNVTEAQAFSNLLTSKYASLRDRWAETKQKLMQNSALPGLDFKRWNKSTGHWSVRINDNFRAHLRPIPQSAGMWTAEEFGPHKAMGHG